MSDSPIQGALLRCEGLLVGYGGKALLPAVDLEIASGEFWSVIGRNGSGKSTWFRTLLGLIPPVGGQVVWPNGKVKLTYVAQRIRFDDLIPVSVEQVVAMGLERGWSFLGPRPKMNEKVAEALEAVKADHLADRTFRSLSEGQKQRVLLARMVASGAQVALLDEPTAAMDAVAEHEAMTLLSELRARYNMAVIVVSHHLEEALEHADRVVFFDPDAGVVINDTPRGLQARPEFLARYGAHLNEVQGQVHHGEVGGGASHPSTRSHGHSHGHGHGHGNSHGHGHGPGKGPGETEPS